MSNIFKSRIKSYILIGFVVFILMIVLSSYLTYQQYQIVKKSREAELIHELNTVKDNLNRGFMYDFSITKNLAFIVSHYGVPDNFDSVAHLILESNPGIDALQLTKGGVITHVYPLAGNQKAIGYNILKDPKVNKDAFLALEKKTLFYTRPIELKQGGKAVVGRLPIFVNGKFFGFSVVIIRIPTLLRSAGINMNNDYFSYQLSKLDLDTDKEEFFLPGFDQKRIRQAFSTPVLNGEWRLYVMYKDDSATFFNVIMFLILGVIVSVSNGIFSFYLAKQPEKLRGLVKKKTKELAESEKYFRSIIEKSSDAIVLMDENTMVLYQSPSVEKILGYAPGVIDNIRVADLIHQEEKRRVGAMFSRLIQTPGGIVQNVLRCKNSHGQYLWLEGTFTNLMDDPSIKGIVYNFHDITKRREAKLVLRNITNDLMQRNTDLQQFAYIVSHNLRAPIANILGLANIMEYAESEEERKQLQSYLFGAVKKMDEIIKDLNKILQARNENLENKENINLEELVKNIATGFENIIQKESVQLEMDFHDVKEINSVKSYIQSVFYNLILNSIKYRSLERIPLIRIKSEKADGKVKITFKDNGRGIDLQRSGREIFRLYKRFHLDVEGKGVGLYMVKTQIEALGGQIDIRSQPGVGTEFIITLPL